MKAVNIPECCAFGWAYKWWLSQDAHYLSRLGGKPGKLNKDWIGRIGRTYSVNRTLKSETGDAKERFRQLVRTSGQHNDMSLVDRAACIVECLDGADHGLSRHPFSFFSKISWFVWPKNWTMFDSYASRAVLGRARVGKDAFRDFYSALHERGWDSITDSVREAIAAPFDKRMTERVIDAYLSFAGLTRKTRVYRSLEIDSFRLALPTDLRQALDDQSARIAAILAPGTLLSPSIRHGLR